MNKVKPTAKKIAANQKNSEKSSGPINTISTRFNAVRHGLLGAGLCELDEPEKFRSFLAELKKQLKPVGILEEECVQQIAVLIIRIRRARFFEAEAFTAHLNPPETVFHGGNFEFDTRALGWTEVVDLGLPAQVSMDAVDQVNRTILRYESAAERKFFRWLNQLDRLQRARRGESLPPPGALDVSLHHEHPDLASFGNSLE